FVENKSEGRLWEEQFDFHLAAGKKITLTTEPHPKYSGGGASSVINGVFGSDERYGDAEWLGFAGDDFEAVIEFGETKQLNEIKLRFFKGEGQWIYLPAGIEIFASTDGKDYQSVAQHGAVEGDKKVIETTLALPSVDAAYIKVLVKNFGIIPEKRQGGGNAAWLFVDEVVLR
ncbi:MAG: discoidin domain-containing protein, partial [Saprospiraceae bacterium]